MTPVFFDHPNSSVSLLVQGREHIDLFLRLQNNPATREYLARYMPIGRIGEEKWLADRVEDKNNIALVIGQKSVHKPKLTPIGSLGLHQIDWKNRRATTGAAILPESCGKGHGSDAKMLLLAYAFLELGFNKVESRVLATNLRSQAYNCKCGYQEVGRLKKHVFRNGAFVDEIVMEVMAEEWLPLWSKFERGEFGKKGVLRTFPGHLDARGIDASTIPHWRAPESAAPGVHG
jgi:RimJ/RimL family protein N-acetyltransferase